jgi:hypothetical protein
VYCVRACFNTPSLLSSPRSVAIALLGDPLVVYLDEPTTGMDPISRRHVWDVIGECAGVSKGGHSRLPCCVWVCVCHSSCLSYVPATHCTCTAYRLTASQPYHLH